MSEIDFKTGSGSKVGIGGSKLALNRDKTTTTDQAVAKESPISAVARSASLNLQDTATQTTYNPTLPTEVPLDQIWREDVQVRLVHVDNAIENLAKSIEKIGLQQPIVVRHKVNPKNPKQTYCVVAGHTRFGSYRLLDERHSDGKFSRIPAIKVDISDKNLLELQFAENEERYELLPIEVARALTILFNVYKASQPTLTEKEFVLDKQNKYQANYVSMIKIMNLFKLTDQIESLEWFGNLNIKWANIADDILKLFQSLIREQKITTFEEFKNIIEDEKNKQGFDLIDQRAIKKIIAEIKRSLLGKEKIERAKKDSDIQQLSDIGDYNTLVSNGSIDALGATIQYAIKDCEKQDLGALLKALGERIGEDELGEMLYTHLHR